VSRAFVRSSLAHRRRAVRRDLRNLHPLAAYGVFAVLAETFGWSRGAIATALSINLLVGGLPASASARWPIVTARD
jgi:hypothetical protein